MNTSLTEIALLQTSLRAQAVAILPAGTKAYDSTALNNETILTREEEIVVKAVHPPVYRPATTQQSGYQQATPAMISWFDMASQKVRFCRAEDAIQATEKPVAKKGLAFDAAGLCTFFLAGCLTAMAITQSATASETGSAACPKIENERLLSVVIKGGETRCIYHRQLYGAGGATQVKR